MLITQPAAGGRWADHFTLWNSLWDTCAEKVNEETLGDTERIRYRLYLFSAHVHSGHAHVGSQRALLCTPLSCWIWS